MQVELIAATAAAAESATINLAQGETLQISALGSLVDSETVTALHSSDGGTTFNRITGASNNRGVLLDSTTNRNTLTGEGIFRVSKSLTSMAVGVVSG